MLFVSGYGNIVVYRQNAPISLRYQLGKLAILPIDLFITVDPNRINGLFNVLHQNK